MYKIKYEMRMEIISLQKICISNKMSETIELTI